ncbi:hypothetical protein ACLE20_08685 [Rhizobium sp. YIM 134829]|uniref:hypothetical protein n=1 Tax=Rhizobium sp. YIM 134829 TaxID=3390453 RepID=UPI00397D726B
MSRLEPFSPPQSEVEIVEAAVLSLCAERSITLRSQAGLGIAGAAIDLFWAGYRTQEALRAALSTGGELSPA